MFDDFQENPASYDACVRFWEHLTHEIELKIGCVGEWNRWVYKEHGGGVPNEFDGNPIWDGRSRKCDRAYRIIQHAEEGPGLGMCAWLNHSDPEFTELPRDELVISLPLSDGAVKTAQDLLTCWMTPTYSPSAMQALIQQLFPEDEDEGACSAVSPTMFPQADKEADMWIRGEIRSAIKELALCATELSPEEACIVRERLDNRHAVTGPSPLWERLRISFGVHDPEGWRHVAECLPGTVILLVWDSQGVCGFRFEQAQALPPLLDSCSGFEFYVCDEAGEYLIAFNHHDFLIGSGKALSWVRGRGDPSH